MRFIFGTYSIHCTKPNRWYGYFKPFSMPQQRLAKAVRILLVLILLVVILVYARPFLVPLAFAGVFSLLLLPVTRWLERRGINKAVATLLTLLAFLCVFAALFFFIGWQLSNITAAFTEAAAAENRPS
jgi:predicted PurR-regulated permease PerM